eukprot:SAG25_NODE_193_length_12184_cov_5.527844_18_plen_193_part_00
MDLSVCIDPIVLKACGWLLFDCFRGNLDKCIPTSMRVRMCSMICNCTNDFQRLFFLWSVRSHRRAIAASFQGQFHSCSAACNAMRATCSSSHQQGATPWLPAEITKQPIHKSCFGSPGFPRVSSEMQSPPVPQVCQIYILRTQSTTDGCACAVLAYAVCSILSSMQRFPPAATFLLLKLLRAASTHMHILAF